MFSASRLCTLGVLLLGGLVFFPLPVSAVDANQVKALLRQAQAFEERAEWAKACEIYETLLRTERATPGVREKFQSAMRRYWQDRRHHDISYRKEVLSIDYGQALRLYTKVSNTLLDGSVEKKKLNSAKLFRKGLEELDNALMNLEFRKAHLPTKDDAAILEFRAFLQQNWAHTAHNDRAKVVKQIREVALAAQNMLQLDTTVTVMEFLCGACSSIDEYTLYLTPNQLRELCDSLKSENVGVGIQLAMQDNRLVIGEVAMASPAAERGLIANSQIISINRKMVGQLSPEAAKDLLDGPNGSTVEIEILAPGMVMAQSVTLSRRAIFMSSISPALVDGFGYIRIHCFQDTTVRDIDQAMAEFANQKISALILDLRGNSGGLFESAIDVARRYLATGIITSLEHQDPRRNGIVYESKNPNAFAKPLVVLVDGDTASAAEVLAGALKENKRARLVGQQTFGKGCTQIPLRLPNAAGVPTGGLRLTVARFFSPDGQPYTGRGIQPDVIVDRPAMGSMNMVGPDPQLEAGKAEAARLVQMLR